MTKLERLKQDEERARTRRPAHQGTPGRMLGPVVRLATVLNGAFLAGIVMLILFGGVADHALGDNELNLPWAVIWSWVFAMPVTVGLALVASRWSGMSWARNVNATIGVLWVASIPLLWTGGVIAG